MTRITNCQECGERERVGFQRDGVCRECRGIDTDRKRIGGYVSPDQAEAQGEALDHAEARSRRRVLANDRIQEESE